MDKTMINPSRMTLLNKLTNLMIEGVDAKEFIIENIDEFDVVTPFEVFAIEALSEFSLTKEYSSKDIKAIAGKLVNILRSGLLNFKWNKNISLIKKLMNEGQAIKDKFNCFKHYIKESNYQKLLEEIDIIEELKKRFLKMQNIIFSILEIKKVNSKPFKVMWSLHDDAITLHKELVEKLKNNDKDLNTTIGKYFFLVLGIIEKEELFILPILSEVLTYSEFENIEKEADSYGYTFISEKTDKDIVGASYNNTTKGNDDYLFKTNNGSLSLDELIAILSTVGDITFIDSNNKVKFFNAPFKHFPRSSSIIGRNVKNCHPDKSLDKVNTIIEKFRDGSENRVDFWINIKDRLILISYFAIRNSKNKYLGVMELTQDITEIKNISGQKRILDFK